MNWSAGLLAAIALAATGCNQILGIGDIRVADDAAPRANDAREIDAPVADTAIADVDAPAIEPDSKPTPPDAKVTPPDADVTAGMVLIPAGLFERGCNASIEDCTNKDDELPFAELTLSTFHIDTTEVTQAAYKQCVDAHACTSPSANFDPAGHADYPVADVTWAQATTYCTWAGKRLPTEAEWEKAARGTDGRTYPWGNLAPTCAQAFWLQCPGGDTASVPVDTRPAGESPYLVQDMAGNINEWVNDWYSNSYYLTAPANDPQGPSTGTYKLVRGGGWGYGSLYLRVANRYYVAPTTELDQIGFRCASSG